MVDLINDLLALSRLERLQGTEILFEDQNLASLLQAAVNTCSHRIKEKGMQVRVDCPDDLDQTYLPRLLSSRVQPRRGTYTAYLHSTSNVTACRRWCVVSPCGSLWCSGSFPTS